MLTHMYACTNTHGHTPMFSRFFFCILATRHGLEMRTVTCSPRLTLPDICLIRKTLHRSLTRKKTKQKTKKESSLGRQQALFFHFTRSQGQSPRSSLLLDVCGGTQMSAIFWTDTPSSRPWANCWDSFCSNRGNYSIHRPPPMLSLCIRVKFINFTNSVAFLVKTTPVGVGTQTCVSSFKSQPLPS